MKAREIKKRECFSNVRGRFLRKYTKLREVAIKFCFDIFSVMRCWIFLTFQLLEGFSDRIQFVLRSLLC